MRCSCPSPSQLMTAALGARGRWHADGQGSGGSNRLEATCSQGLPREPAVLTFPSDSGSRRAAGHPGPYYVRRGGAVPHDTPAAALARAPRDDLFLGQAQVCLLYTSDAADDLL